MPKLYRARQQYASKFGISEYACVVDQLEYENLYDSLDRAEARAQGLSLAEYLAEEYDEEPIDYFYEFSDGSVYVVHAHLVWHLTPIV